MKHARLEQTTTSVSLIETFESSRLFICNHQQTINKRGETFCEGLKWVCKLFEINGQKDFQKPAIFSKSSKHFVKELAQGNSYKFSLASFLESGILDFSPLSHSENKLPVKLWKSLC